LLSVTVRLSVGHCPSVCLSCWLIASKQLKSVCFLSLVAASF